MAIHQNDTTGRTLEEHSRKSPEDMGKKQRVLNEWQNDQVKALEKLAEDLKAVVAHCG